MRSRAACFLCAVLLLLLLAAVAGTARAEALAFLPAVDYTTGQWPHAIAVADFNNDGIKDLVTANYGEVSGSSTVSVLLGDGRGGFGAKTDFDTTGTDPESVAVADFNSDGKQDLVTANFLDRHRQRAARQRQRRLRHRVPTSPPAPIPSRSPSATSTTTASRTW